MTFSPVRFGGLCQLTLHRTSQSAISDMSAEQEREYVQEAIERNLRGASHGDVVVFSAQGKSWMLDNLTEYPGPTVRDLEALHRQALDKLGSARDRLYAWHEKLAEAREALVATHKQDADTEDVYYCITDDDPHVLLAWEDPEIDEAEEDGEDEDPLGLDDEDEDDSTPVPV